MLDEGFAQRQPALIHQHDLADSSARRIGFEAPEFVRRAVIQAQAAMNAARVVVVGGNVRAGKSAARFRAARLVRRLLLGSVIASDSARETSRGSGHFADRKTFFTRRINAKSGRGGPHTPSTRVFTSVGHHSSIAEALISGLPQT